MNTFSIKRFRDSLNLSQAELAEKIGREEDGTLRYSQSTISRWETDPGSIPYDALRRLAELAGVTIDELTSYEKPPVSGLTIDNTWRYPAATREAISHYVHTFLESHTLPKEEQQYITDFCNSVKAITRKPKVALVGRSDVGKSTMINSLLGAEKMPTSWTPTTSIIVYIKHITDRPAYLKDNECFVFQPSPKDNSWSDQILEDEALTKETLICEGSASLLQDYGTRQGEKDLSSNAVAAVLYLKADILNNCDLIDVPGYGTGDRSSDDQMVLEAKQQADVLIYLCLAAAFLRAEDNAYLTEAISSLRPLYSANDSQTKRLSNLYIVASQAQMVADSSKKGPDSLEKSLDSLTNILDDGCTRLEASLPEEYLSLYIAADSDENDGEAVERDAHTLLRSRFFYYAKDKKEYHEAFYQDLRQLLEYLPYQINENLLAFLRETKSPEESVFLTQLTAQLSYYKDLLHQQESFAQRLRELQSSESERKIESQKARSDIRTEISSALADSSREFSALYKNVLTEDFIVSIIKKKGYKKKKDDILALSNYISALLDSRMQRILRTYSKNISKVVDAYVKDFSEISKVKGGKRIPLDMFGFDARRIFASGLAGAATYGGLAFWASTCGNLGAYILVAKGVSILSSIGISTGGTAAAISAVASIGGPVVLGIALALLAAMSMFAVFSGGWQKVLARKLVKSFEDNDVYSTYIHIIETYWSDTQTAFNKAADTMEAEWQAHLKKLSTLLNEYNTDDLLMRHEQLENVKSFFENLPE